MMGKGTTGALLIVLGMSLLVAANAQAQVLGAGNPNAPYLPFVYLPTLQAEVRATPIYMELSGGKEIVYEFVDGGTQSSSEHGLKDDFNMTKPDVLFDAMVRLTAGPVSLRLHYDSRTFVGVGRNSTPKYSVARLEYSGIRLGGDIDLFRWNGSRVGIDFDYDVYHPIFTEGIKTPGGKIIEGEAAMTIGIHGEYSPTFTYYGMNPVFDANIRFPLRDTKVTDFRVGAGVRFLETVLGTWALKLGYRRTNLDFRESLVGRVETTFGGFFGELAYYY